MDDSPVPATPNEPEEWKGDFESMRKRSFDTMLAAARR